MTKRPVIMAKYLPNRLPITGTAVGWLLYRELDMNGVAAGIYLGIVGLFLSIAWIVTIAQLFMVKGMAPVLKEEE